jgi:hypothetical protein
VASNIAFQATGPSVVLSAGATTSNVEVTVDTPAQQFSITNTGSAAVAIAFGRTNAVTAAFPTSGNAQDVHVIPGSSRVVITGIQASTNNTVYVAGIAASGTCVLYICPGEGLA